MATEIQHFTATIPAGTPIGAPAVVAVTIPVRVVRQIDWRTPAGPMGTFGWQIAMGGVKIFPTGGDKYVVANDEHGSWPVEHAPDGGTWQVVGYNTGVYNHAVYLVFHCDLPTVPEKVPAPLAPEQLMQAPDLSKLGPPLARPL